MDKKIALQHRPIPSLGLALYDSTPTSEIRGRRMDTVSRGISRVVKGRIEHEWRVDTTEKQTRLAKTVADEKASLFINHPEVAGILAVGNLAVSFINTPRHASRGRNGSLIRGAIISAKALKTDEISTSAHWTISTQNQENGYQSVYSFNTIAQVPDNFSDAPAHVISAPALADTVSGHRQYDFGQFPAASDERPEIYRSIGKFFELISTGLESPEEGLRTALELHYI